MKTSNVNPTVNSAVFLSWKSNPYRIKLQWGTSIYEYFVDSIKDIHTFLYIKSKSVNKAAIWIKKQSYQFTKVDTSMMANDVNIENFKALLTKDGWIETDPQCKEYVFQYPVKSITKSNVVVKVYSSIAKNSNNMRPKGTDAIRVFAINLTAKKPLTKCKRVYRTPNWRENFKDLVNEVYKEAIHNYNKR